MDISAEIRRRPPQLAEIRRALFIQPHPDDNEIGAGGTMALLARMGAEVWELTVTDDRFVSTERSPEGLTHRQQEALAAQAVLGAKNAGFLGYATRSRTSIEDYEEAILPVIRRLHPDAVFTCDPWLVGECHGDHVKIGTAVCWAVSDARSGYFPPLPDNARHPDAYKVPILGLYFTADANTYVDIAETAELKRRAIACHADNLYPEFTDVYFDLQRVQAAENGHAIESVECLKLLANRHLHLHSIRAE